MNFVTSRLTFALLAALHVPTFAADVPMTSSLASLPKKSSGFLWGVANAAFQVEGSPLDSDWRRFTHMPGKIADGSTADEATNFWNDYEQDFALAEKIGVNSFRISLAWERIEPRKGEWDESALDHYEQMILSMRKHGMEPIVTLQHFVLPGWLADEGGLRSRDFPKEFADYALKVVSRLSGAPAHVSWWMTFNEPMVLVNAGYVAAEWPPGKTNDFQGAMEAAANIARAHIQATMRIRAARLNNVKMGVATHWRLFNHKPGDLAGGMLVNTFDWVFNRQMMTAVTTGKISFWMPGALWPVNERIKLPEGRSTIDFMGINYYGRTILSLQIAPPFFKLEEGPGPRSDIDWEMYPEGMYLALKDLQSYGLPILITENGVADARDEFRAKFLKDHLSQMNRAIKEGVNVVGYLHWSLTDNFEWAKGNMPRFGLVEYDYATKKRTPRASYYLYKSLIR